MTAPVQAAPVAAGWQLVPCEPTEAMITASYLYDAKRIQRSEMYRAMIAAAPVAAPVAQGDDDLLEVVRCVCSMAAHLRDMDDEKRKHYPSPLSECSPMLEAAQAACVKRGYTEDGLATDGMLAASTPADDRLTALQAQVDLLSASLEGALSVITDYLEYEHNGDPWTEDARAMGEMDINEYGTDGRLEIARAALAAAGAA